MTDERCVFIPAVNQVEVRPLEEIPGVLEPGQVRLAPRYVGICGSDLHLLKGEHPVGKPPTVPGHEMCAEVTEVGPGVSGISVGDRAIVDPIMPCGQCVQCRAGRVNLCEPPMVAGFRAPGFARTTHVVPARNLHLAPRDLDWTKLILAEPGACASHCVSRLLPDQLSEVLVIGAGTIGLTIVQALRIVGAGRIVVIEFDSAKRDLALQLGATEAYEPAGLPDHLRFSAVIDVVSIQSTMDEAFQRVRPGGRVVMMGVPSATLSVPAPAMQRFERDLVGSGMYVPEDFDRAVAWIASGQFDTTALVSDVYDLADAPAAFTAAQRPENIKTLIRLY